MQFIGIANKHFRIYEASFNMYKIRLNSDKNPAVAPGVPLYDNTVPEILRHIWIWCFFDRQGVFDFVFFMRKNKELLYVTINIGSLNQTIIDIS